MLGTCLPKGGGAMGEKEDGGNNKYEEIITINKELTISIFADFRSIKVCSNN